VSAERLCFARLLSFGTPAASNAACSCAAVALLADAFVVAVAVLA